MSLSVVIVDDDVAFCDALSSAFIKRDYEIKVANNIAELEALDNLQTTQYGVVDLRIGADSGLNAINILLNKNPKIKIVMLTAYASIATAVEAMRLGATNYLTKPASVQDIIDKLQGGNADSEAQIEDTPLSVKRMEWEYLQKVLLEHDGNVSAAARALNMHRRTLQRKLQKYPVKR